MNRNSFIALTLTACAFMVTALPARADDNDTANDYRLALAGHHNIKENLTGFGELGYRWNPDKDHQVYTTVWPGVTYLAGKWVQFSAGLRTLYTDNQDSADTLELRPFGGMKLFVPNESDWHIYNYTRYEFRDTQDRNTHEWTAYHRVRSQFGCEIPLTAREKAWKPKTWLVAADVEPFYRFDHDRVDPLWVGGGLGYVVNDRIRLEFDYHAQFTRPSGSRGLEYTDNIFLLNIKIGLHQGILGRLANAHANE